MLEVWEHILALPVIGIIDADRSMDLTSTLLQRIADKGYQCLIVDVTGVNDVDPATAELLIKLIRATRLLGTYCVVTGVQHEIARTLVERGVSLHEVKTLRSLKDGLRYCFAYLRAHGRRSSKMEEGVSQYR